MSTRLWRLFFSFIPLLLLAFLLDAQLLRNAALVAMAAAWIAATSWAGNRMAGFACPRCGEPFYENRVFFKPLRHNCAHCNLPRGTNDTPPAATGA